MRLLPVLLLSTLGAVASADQLIDIPTGRKIPFEDVRYEIRLSPAVGGGQYQFLGMGIGHSFELDLRDVVDPGTHPRGTFDFSYNYLSALPGISPGISVGVQDAANLTQDGRRYYLVTTFRNEMDNLPGNLYTDVTVGFQFGALTSPFLGVAMPLSSTAYLIAEHSGYRINAGIEFRPAPKVTVRFIQRGQQTLISLSAIVKF